MLEPAPGGAVDASPPPPRGGKAGVPLDLPAFPDITAAALAAIAGRHDVRPEAVAAMPQTGIFNAIYALGPDLVLRVPRAHPAFVHAAEKEALAVPAARAAGVRTPALVAFDDSRELIAVPFTVYERVHGDTLGVVEPDPVDARGAWRELGRDLARLHVGVRREGPLGGLELEGLPDARRLAADLGERGFYGAAEARWFERWLERLEGLGAGEAPVALLHGDTQSTNVMVRGAAREYLAVIDWGASGWGDPAADFLGMPLRAVPLALDGYREVAPGAAGDATEARVLLKHLQVALFTMGRGPQPGKSWGERPLGYALDILRFLLETRDERWRALRP